MSDTPAPRPDIDPALAALLAAVPMDIDLSAGVEVARENLRALTPSPDTLPAMRIEERTIAFGDVTDLPVRIYWPPVAEHDDLPVVVYYHGGGWCIGDLDTYDHVARAHAIGAKAIVVSVDYRLAPEHPYPQAVDDAWAAAQWVGEHAAELGGDPTRIAVAGDSAGGNLSGVVALRARDAGGPPLVFQLLWYPAVSLDLSLPSFTENAEAPILSRAVADGFARWYLPEFDLGDPAALPTDVAPANAESFAGLPATYIGTAEHDPLRDDGARYAGLLSAADVPVVLHNAATLVHGYVGMALVIPAAAAATERGLSALKTALHPTA